jgi:hypothetical protein
VEIYALTMAEAEYYPYLSLVLRSCITVTELLDLLILVVE